MGQKYIAVIGTTDPYQVDGRAVTFETTKTGITVSTDDPQVPLVITGDPFDVSLAFVRMLTYAADNSVMVVKR